MRGTSYDWIPRSSHNPHLGSDRSYVPLSPSRTKCTAPLEPPQASLPSVVLVSRPADRSLSSLPLPPPISHTLPSLARWAFAFASRQRHCRRSWPALQDTFEHHLQSASRLPGYGHTPASNFAVRFRAVTELPLEVNPSQGETWACVCSIVHTRTQRIPQPVRHTRTLHSQTLDTPGDRRLILASGFNCCFAAATVLYSCRHDSLSLVVAGARISRQRAPPQ